MSEDLQHLAVQANIKSMSNAMAKNKEAWLDLFADNAVVKDPVGISPLDPAGLGHQGKEIIALFWDNVIAKGDMKLTAKKRITSGDRHCAVEIEGKNSAGGVETTVEMMVIYEVDDAGKIIALSAHWSFDDLMKQYQ